MKIEGKIIVASRATIEGDIVQNVLEQVYSCKVTGYPLDNDADLKEAKAEEDVTLIVIFTTFEDDTKAQGIHKHWHTTFPQVPIVWCHGDSGSTFYGANWPNVKWCSDDRFPHESLRDPQVFDRFTTERVDKKTTLDMLKQTIEATLH